MENGNPEKVKHGFRMVDGNTFIEIEDDGTKTESPILPNQRTNKITLDDDIDDRCLMSVSARIPGWIYKLIRLEAWDSNSSISSSVVLALSRSFNGDDNEMPDDSIKVKHGRSVSITLSDEVADTYIKEAELREEKVSKLLSSFLSDLAYTGFTFRSELIDKGNSETKIKLTGEQLGLLKKLMASGIVHQYKKRNT